MMQAQKSLMYEVILDVRGLDIKSVKNQNGVDVNHYISTPKPALGSALHMQLDIPMNRDELRNFTIEYETIKEEQTATSWLKPEQTAGGKQAYMFTQCESVHCRSVAPLQDTPAIKSTYTVTTRTPQAYNTFVSGKQISADTDTKTKVTVFEMTIPVESYLLAIASGPVSYTHLTLPTIPLV